MVEFDNNILNEILSELQSIKKEINDLENKIDSLSFTKKDLELFNLIEELDENKEFLNEEDLIKSGFKI